jgi:two-component system chemotaxis sensor kinase CheA
MPGMDGMQLAAALQADRSTAGIPLIALSSHAKPGMLADLRQAGFRDFVAKFDRPGLIAAIKDVTSSWNEAA